MLARACPLNSKVCLNEWSQSVSNLINPKKAYHDSYIDHTFLTAADQWEVRSVAVWLSPRTNENTTSLGTRVKPYCTFQICVEQSALRWSTETWYIFNTKHGKFHLIRGYTELYYMYRKCLRGAFLVSNKLLIENAPGVICCTQKKQEWIESTIR